MMEHTFQLRAEWSSRDTPHPKRGFTRDILIQADGPGELQGSAARAFHGDTSRWNPEQLLLAALAECHILSYLFVAGQEKLAVSHIEVGGELLLSHDLKEGGQVASAVLRPQVWLDEATHDQDPQAYQRAGELHETAHQQCFIARSVNFPVAIKPVTTGEPKRKSPQFTTRLGAPIALRPPRPAKKPVSVTGATGSPAVEQRSFYDQVGGHETFAKLARVFYEQVATDPEFRALYPEEDLGPAEARLRMFLEQYWGGPTTYSQQRGHPRLRKRHMPFEIGPQERDTWLKYMKVAVKSLDLAPLQEETLWDYLERAAHAMQNRS